MFRSVLLHLFEIICHILPVSTRKIYFLSFAGQYNDNPKAISERLHEIAPDIIQYWAISNKSKQNDIPDYIHLVQHNSFKSIYVKNRCRVVVDNGAGFSLFYSENPILFSFKKLLKNKKQFNLSTWHGNPIKHIGAQIPGEGHWTVRTAFSSSDLLIAGCSLVKNIFEEAFINLMPVKLEGTPRTDILFKDSRDKCLNIKNKLGLPLDKKILLYAPTYRYSPRDSGIEQINRMNLNELMATLSRKFGGDWIFVMRVHNMVLLEIQEGGYLEQYNDIVYDGNSFDDMNEYLFVCDALLTDYSGCIYDVSLTNKPCFLFAHDRENYEKRERGVYSQLSEFPYSFSSSFEELIKNILSYDYETIDNKRRSFLDKIGNNEDGHASDRISEIIISHMS